MDTQNPVYTVHLEDLRLEVVLDSGFLAGLSFSDEIHAHAYYELILALQDGVRIEVSRQPGFLLQAGQACLIPPGIYHRATAAQPHAGKLAVRFHDAREGRGSLYQPLSKALENCHCPIALGDQPMLHRTLLELRRELQDPQLGQELFLQSLLQQSFLLLFRQLSAEYAGADTAREEGDAARRLQLEDFLSRKFHLPITQQDLSEHMHLSRRQTSRILQKIYGKSFRSLLVEIRLQRAAQLLAETGLPVDQVAQRCGYTSLSGFYDAFRKTYGTTAGQYRSHSEKPT